MEVIVIGGSGFLDTRLGRLLTQAAENFKIVEKAVSGTYPARTVLADVIEVETLGAAIQEGATVINLAAEHRDDVRPLSLYDEVKVGGTGNVCSVASHKPLRCTALRRLTPTSRVRSPRLTTIVAPSSRPSWPTEPGRQKQQSSAPWLLCGSLWLLVNKIEIISITCCAKLHQASSSWLAIDLIANPWLMSKT